jgi:cysteinyl-tRNA synthetase
MDKVLGLDLAENNEEIELTSEQKELIKDRDKARLAGDFVRSDEIRNQLIKQNILIEDTPEGTKVLTKR